jgi:long-chain-fatty-acid--CoA ligase ACSBG
MSEATGPVLFNSQGSWKAGTSGIPIAGIEIKLHEQDGNGEGELCYRGRNVMMGYHRKQDTTLESLDSEGWFRSGDLAVVDKDGFYTITGRRKELLITSGGENIAPVPIEDSIKRELPFISNVIVVGDHRNFLTCLLTLKCEIDVETAEPTDILTSEAIKLLAAKGSTATKVSDVVDNQDKAVFTAIEEGLERANANAVSNAATVKKWSLLDVDFSESGGELG